jgi:hypothetical protein
MDQITFYIGWILGKMASMEGISREDELLETTLWDYAANKGCELPARRKK